MKIRYHSFQLGEVPILGRPSHNKLREWIPHYGWRIVKPRRLKSKNSKDWNFPVRMFTMKPSKLIPFLQKTSSKLPPHTRGDLVVCLISLYDPPKPDTMPEYLIIGLLHAFFPKLDEDAYYVPPFKELPLTLEKP